MRFTLLLAILITLLSNFASAQTAFEHEYYECTGSSQRCGQVFYSVEDEKGLTVAVVLKDPQLALKIPGLAMELEADGRKLKQVCTPPDGKDSFLELYQLDKKNPSIAGYKLLSCKSEAFATWLARALVDRKKVKTAGVLIRPAAASSQLVLIGELLIEVEKTVDLPLRPSTKEVLAAFGLELVAPDPFDARRVLLQARKTAKPTSTSVLDAIDILSCVTHAERRLRATHEPDSESAKAARRDNVKDCLERHPVGADVTTQLEKLDEAAATETLTRFAALGPRLVRPTMIFVSPQPSAGFDAWLASEKKKEDGFTGSLTFNSTSNETDTDDDARLSVDAEIEKGDYPAQLRFEIGAQVEFDDDQVEENVTQLLVNYDHYLTPWLEVYGFVERFGNSFLGIDQRWEGGGGAKLEYELRSRHRDGFCHRQSTHRGYRGRDARLTRQASERLDEYRARIREELFREGYVSADMVDQYCKYQPGIFKRNSVLQVSLALSVFLDFEQPETIKLTAVRVTPMMNVDDPTEDVAPPSMQLGRLTLRPKITWRPTDRVKVTSLYYHKLALDSEDDASGTGSDVRKQWNVSAELRFKTSTPKASIVANWTRYEDTRPPTVASQDALDAFGFTGTSSNGMVMATDGTENFTIQLLGAEDRHTVVKFGMKVEF